MQSSAVPINKDDAAAPASATGGAHPQNTDSAILLLHGDDSDGLWLDDQPLLNNCQLQLLLLNDKNNINNNNSYQQIPLLLHLSRGPLSVSLPLLQH